MAGEAAAMWQYGGIEICRLKYRPYWRQYLVTASCLRGQLAAAKWRRQSSGISEMTVWRKWLSAYQRRLMA